MTGAEMHLQLLEKTILKSAKRKPRIQRENVKKKLIALDIAENKLKESLRYGRKQAYRLRNWRKQDC